MKPDLRFFGIDLPLLASFTLLMLVGWLMIFAVNYQAEDFTGFFNLKRNDGKQLLFIFLSLGVVFSLQVFAAKLIQPLGFFLYGLSLVLLVAVLFTRPINGSTSWFDVGGFRFQPSELAKTATALCLSYFLSLPEVRLKDWKHQAQALGIVALPMLLVLLQGDVGSMLVFLSFAIVLFRAGMMAWVYVMGLGAIALFILTIVQENMFLVFFEIVVLANLFLIKPLRFSLWLLFAYLSVSILSYYFLAATDFSWYLMAVHFALSFVLGTWHFFKNFQLALVVGVSGIFALVYVSSIDYFVYKILKPHQQERIMVWLQPEKTDPLGPRYNLDQSKHAIGSGGWNGKGFLMGERTKLDYVPEQSTDFIFCTVGEEWGFVGSLFVLGLFMFLLWRILFLAEQERCLPFTTYYAYSIAGILFIHVFINVGMTIGLVPVIGIPLPFISYGGSSLLAFSLMMGILIRLLRQPHAR